MLKLTQEMDVMIVISVVTSCTALVASGVPNQVQAGTGDVHNPHTSVPRLPDRFCTPLQQQ